MLGWLTFLITDTLYHVVCKYIILGAILISSYLMVYIGGFSSVVFYPAVHLITNEAIESSKYPSESLTNLQLTSFRRSCHLFPILIRIKKKSSRVICSDNRLLHFSCNEKLSCLKFQERYFLF